ncbi:protease SohB [Marinomonas communis]|uniref:Inner membrane peptidase n=1 Tax=Marinomonas communis TaxID=28254 RepID=A0A4R6XHV6_9GAMM|nr:protease SohB [Marinomonas communis]TDR15468.1 inner membrane peptidase [Marinomonas communis]
MEFLADYAGFLIRLLSIALIILLILSVVASGKSKQRKGGNLTISKLNEGYQAMKSELSKQLFDKKTLKQQQKALKKQKKEEQKQKVDQEEKKRIYVIDFDGDMKASAVQSMREEITAILSVATAKDEVVVRLESPGGVVHGYGLAASQLQRIKDKGVPLTVTVDKVAASGGYMMACVADKIVAAPFAILGSIGVVAQVPNIHRLLERNTIDVELHTAGKYKRTLTMLGENTDEGREKFKQDLEDTHELFKRFVSTNRPVLDIETIATGETWYGSEAVENKLADSVMTSDAYLEQFYADYDVLQVSYRETKGLTERIGLGVFSALEQKATKWLSKAIHHRGF